MATTLTDTRTLHSASDAFSTLPVPSVRNLERQIRNDMTSNRERLRSLVGSSYRDLLATAATIGDMDVRMRRLEGLLADDISRKCNTGLLERSRVRGKALMDRARAPTTEAFALASQVAVFRACPDVVVGILRENVREEREGGRGLLTAAKVLVVARLLFTQRLSVKGEGGTERWRSTVQQTMKRLRSAREKVMVAIERRLAGEGQSVERLLDAMSAYALVTTSSAADVLRHFHAVRAMAVRNAFTGDVIEGIVYEDDERQASDPVKALNVWVQTLRDTQTVFPRQLVTALSQLKSKPLLAGQDVLDIAALDLDVHLHWIDEDIQGFVPHFIRHDDLDIAKAKKQLSSWAPSTLEEYLKRLREDLDARGDLPTVAKLRRECLVAWLSGSANVSGIPRSDVLEGIRKTFSDRLAKLTEQHCTSLSDLSSAINKTLQDWDEAETKSYAPPLWESHSIPIDAGNGGKRFTNSLQASLQGRSRAGNEILRKYQTWLKETQDIEETISSQRKMRWNDLLTTDYDDESDEEESREQELSKDDPDALQKHLNKAIDSALAAFQTSLEASAGAITQPTNDGGDDNNANDSDSTAHAKASLLLRLTREFQSALPSSYTKPFGEALKTQLYSPITQPISRAVAQKHGSAISKSLDRSRKLAVRALWSDSTELPILPSPWAFRVLRTCQAGMEGAGQDLWTKDAVANVKEEVAGRLAEALGKAREGAEQDGEGEDQGKDEREEQPASEDAFIQQLFDAWYLAAALSVDKSPKGAPDEFAKHIEWLVKKAKLGKEKQETVSKSAEEYWKRTSLLFALLG